MMIPLLQHTVDNFIRQAVAYAMLGYLPNRNHGNYYVSFTSLCKLAYCSIFRERISSLAENKDAIRVEYLPKGSSDYNAVEECWRQGKDDLLVSKYYPKFFNLKSAIANYYRTRRFKLDINKYLFRKDS